MDYTKRKKELEELYNKAVEQKNQLNVFIEQTRGRYQEIEQLEKEAELKEKPKIEHKNDKK